MLAGGHADAARLLADHVQPPLQWLITHRNFFVSPLMRRSLRTRLTDDEFAHYCDVLPTPASRAGVAAFPREIRAAGQWLAALEERVAAELRDMPAAFAFGLKDPAFGGRQVIRRWRTMFPSARVVELPEAGTTSRRMRPRNSSG